MNMPSGSESKSWKKVNQERKALKKKYKQETVLKNLEKSKKLEEISKVIELENAKNEEDKPVSTVSIAVPGSILENAQSVELRTYLAGQIARAACIFRVDEVIVFDDICITNFKHTKTANLENGEGNKIVRGSSLQLARILQYLECPQYLRKFFFPLHNDLKYSGLLNPLDAPHHLRQNNIFMYREGVVTDKKVKDHRGSYANVGLYNDIKMDKSLTPGIRVTVRIDNINDFSTKKLKGTVVGPSEPRQKTGIYWGYTVRIANSLSEVFTKSPYAGGYDLTIGTSDKGSNINDVTRKSLKYNHILLVFGGLKGLEAALENDEKLNVDDPQLLFDHYLNVAPNQGSRTIRTEEAIFITLGALQEKLCPEVEDKKFDFQDCIPQSQETGYKVSELKSSNGNTEIDLERFN